MSKTIWVGAVAYTPKVVTIWEGMRTYFHEEAHLPVEVVLFQSYEAQVMALLAPPGESWWACLKGYDFWTRVDDKGRFSIAKVRPGRYTLFLIGANQFEEFRRDDVEVRAGKESDLGELAWSPVTHGRTLWQIGVADRLPHEFKGGDNTRNVGLGARSIASR